MGSKSCYPGTSDEYKGPKATVKTPGEVLRLAGRDQRAFSLMLISFQQPVHQCRDSDLPVLWSRPLVLQTGKLRLRRVQTAGLR